MSTTDEIVSHQHPNGENNQKSCSQRNENEYDLKDVRIIIPHNRDIRKLYVEVTGDCNFSCDMCFRHNFPEAMGAMENRLLVKLCHEIKGLPKLEDIMVGGIGEPFLYPALPDFVACAKKLGKSVSITSNGSLVASRLDWIIASGLDNLFLSFETGAIGHFNEEAFFDLCQRIARRKQELKVDHPRLHLSMVLSRQNIGDVSRIGRRLRGSGISRLFISNLLPVSLSQNKQVLYPGPEPKELKDVRTELLQNVLLDKIQCSIPKFEIKTERYCQFIEQKAMVVRWDGAVAPCYRFLHTGIEFGDGNKKEINAAIFGDLSNQSLSDIWNSREYAWFRYLVHNSVYPSCADCHLKEGCEFMKSTEFDCWGNDHSCADCLWARGIIRCP